MKIQCARLSSVAEVHLCKLGTGVRFSHRAPFLTGDFEISYFIALTLFTKWFYSDVDFVAASSVNLGEFDGSYLPYPVFKSPSWGLVTIYGLRSRQSRPISLEPKTPKRTTLQFAPMPMHPRREKFPHALG